MIRRRVHDASADEQLAGRRASQKHSSKAAGTMAAAGEAAAAAADCMLERRGEADMDHGGEERGCRMQFTAIFDCVIAIFAPLPPKF